MKALKKAAAIICSTIAAAGLAVSSMTAMAYDPVELDDRAAELKSGIVNLIADEVYAEPGETVSYRLLIQNNTGYAPSGIALIYDEALTPVMVENSAKPEMKWGDASYGLTKANTLNADKHLIGYSSVGTENCTNDGTIYTVQFKVPSDAKEGTEYPLELNVEHFLNAKADPVDYNTVKGWIRVRKPEVTTTVVTTTSDTSTSTSTTTVSNITVTTTKPDGSEKETTTTTSQTAPTTTSTTVTSNIETDASTASNTKKTDRQDPVSSEPTTASRAGTTASNKKQPTSGSTTAVKTGDPGVGIAVAALALSASVAVVLKRKKKL